MCDDNKQQEEQKNADAERYGTETDETAAAERERDEKTPIVTNCCILYISFWTSHSHTSHIG